MSFKHWLDRTFYPTQGDNWDDVLFRKVILNHLTSTSVVLDLGAGAGIVSQMNFRGIVSRVCGVDLDPRVVENAYLDEGKIGDASRIPYEDGTFDVVFADNVAEHLDDPGATLAEVWRVLKDDGRFLFKTPNRRHYMPLLARLTPHRFHRFINRLRGRAEADTFPTRYRLNTRADILRIATQAGFSVERIDHVEGRPEYLRIAWPMYLIGIVYERLVNLTSVFSGFRILLIANLKKDV